MNHYLLKRKYRLFILILFAGSIYICFQIFSFKVLNFSTHKSKFYGRNGGKLVQDFHQEDIDENALEENNIMINQKNVLDLVKNENIHNQEIQKGKTGHVLGTYFMQTEDYLVRSDGKFVCLHSKEVIPFSAVNDDYCDCADATDEPGTSACPDSKFYCTFQYKNAEPQHIPGSQVNDGVCDCCDGSDEWENIHVFPGVHLTEKRWKNGLSHAPCENKCAAVELANEEDAKIRHLGQRLKVAYIEAGKKSPKGDMYGPGGVFFKLSLDCYNTEDSEYKFTLCPFKSVTQQKFPQAAVNLGKSPVWKIKVHDVYVLKMEKGDPRGCPGGRFRSTVITFICGLSDKIVKVSEAEKCVYSMTFSTPAAC